MSKKTEQFYNKFSLFYPLIDVFLKPQKRKLFEEINSLPVGQLLEIGVGNGSHLPHYKTHEITGIDTSTGMLKKAERQQKEHIQLLHMNGENLLFPNHSFDYVVLSHTLAVVDNPEKVLQEAHRVLKPNGRIFILNHFTPSNYLKYIDKLFQHVSMFFHFKSLFYIENFATIEQFEPLKEIDFVFSYFKLLIYGKK